MWEDKTHHFSEERRHYKTLYLERTEVMDDKIEVALYSSDVDPYEIYVSYDIMYGIIYTDEKNAERIIAEVKKDIEEDYKKGGEITDEYISYFVEKYKLKLPMDVLFDSDALMDSMRQMFDIFDEMND